MGIGASAPIVKEVPYSRTDATLYYFGGRGLADQIRWMLAYTDVSYTQRVVGTRDRFVNLKDSGQLPFGQLPLLQIDGLELVQSQAIIRYLARRANLTGNDAQEELMCDMLAETILDLIKMATAAPFRRNQSEEAGKAHVATMREKWFLQATRMEMCIERNTKLKLKGGIGGGKEKGKTACLVGAGVTYADVLLAHCLTWYVEECGADIVSDMPLLTEIQYAVLSKPSLQAFLGGKQFYPLGDAAYCEQVATVLARPIGA